MDGNTTANPKEKEEMNCSRDNGCEDCFKPIFVFIIYLLVLHIVAMLYIFYLMVIK